MARTKAFDPEQALEDAMQTFWSNGYEATATPDLERALGINRSSIYATFGSKSELYAGALERYVAGMRGPGPVRPEMLSGPDPVRERFARLLWTIAEEDLRAQRPRGCFAANAAVELAPDQPRIRKLAARAFRDVRKLLRTALEDAQDAGELAPDSDVEALASMLMAVIEGLHVLTKAGRDRKLVGQVIAGAVSALPVRVRAA